MNPWYSTAMLLVFVLPRFAMTDEDAYMIVSRENRLDRLSMDGTTSTTLLDRSVPGNTWALAFDYRDKFLFYSMVKSADDGVKRCSLQGKDDRLIVENTESYGLAVDYFTKSLFWTDHHRKTINVADYTGASPRVLVGNQVFVAGITLDLDERLMYWCLYNSGEIKRANFDGTNVQVIRAQTATWVGAEAIIVDFPYDKLYWSDGNADKLHVTNVDGQSDKILADGHINGIARFKDHVYYTVNDGIKRCGLSGEGIEHVGHTNGTLNTQGIVIVTNDRSARTRPTLEMTRNAGNEAEFVCWMPTIFEGSTFLVDWFSGTTKLLSDIKVTTDRTTVKLENLDERKLESNLFCRSRRLSSDGGHPVIGPARDSNILTADVQVLSKSLHVVEGMGSAELHVRVGLPPVFFAADGIHLILSLETETKELRTTKNKVIPQVVVRSAKTSGAHTSRIEVDDTNWEQSHMFAVRAMQDGHKDGTQTRTLTVSMLTKKAGGGSFSRIVEKTEITIENRDSLSGCMAWNDPRYRTFDGKYFSSHYEGEFVFYKHQFEKYQVNLMLKRCTSRSTGTCVCAVAIRVEGDVLILDKCARSTDRQSEWKASPLRIYILKGGDKRFKMTVWSYNDGKEHVVEMTHGGEVTVRDNSFGALQVTYKPSPTDYGFTEGLCGTYDDDGSNDFMMRSGTVRSTWTLFGRDWRARVDEQTFAGALDNSQEPTDMYCSVLAGETEYCRNDLHKRFSDADGNAAGERTGGKSITEDLLKRFKFEPRPNYNMIITQNQRRRKRSTSTSTTFDPFAPFVVDEDHDPATTVWPTSSGMTEQQARTYCQQTVNGHSGVQHCSTLMSQDFSEMIEDCVDDIGLTDDLDWANATVQTIIHSCVTYINSLDNSRADDEPPPALPGGVNRYALLNNVCFNDCSGNGICQNGSCVCDAGRLGGDCSMSDSDRPEVSYLADDGLCDTASRPCTGAIVYGNKFHDRDTLSCHLRRYQLGTEPLTSDTTGIIIPATFIKFDLIVCPVMENGPYLIRISNDGINSGDDEHVYYSFNSTCTECTSGSSIETTQCSLKLGTCVINGTCYLDEVRNPLNECQRCDSSELGDDWSDVQSGNCGGGMNIVSIVIIVVVAVVVAFLVVVTVAVVAKCIKSGTAAKSPSVSRMKPNKIGLES